MTRGAVLPAELQGVLASIACITDAQSVESYAAWLRGADLEVEDLELNDDALTEMVQQIRTKLLGAEIMVALKKLNLPGVDFSPAKQLAKSALAQFDKVSSAGRSLLPQNLSSLIRRPRFVSSRSDTQGATNGLDQGHSPSEAPAELAQ